MARLMTARDPERVTASIPSIDRLGDDMDDPVTREDVTRWITDLASQSAAAPDELAECEAGRFDAVECTDAPIGADIYAVTITVRRADPALLISTQILTQIMAGLSPHAAYDPSERLVKVDATNGRWIYRVGRPTPDRVALCMRWPD